MPRTLRYIKPLLKEKFELFWARVLGIFGPVPKRNHYKVKVYTFFCLVYFKVQALSKNAQEGLFEESGAPAFALGLGLGVLGFEGFRA